MGPIGCPEMSVRHCHILCLIPRKTQILSASQHKPDIMHFPSQTYVGAMQGWRYIEGLLYSSVTAGKLTRFLQEDIGGPYYEGRYGYNESFCFM
jgi:hypothetical protein